MLNYPKPLLEIADFLRNYEKLKLVKDSGDGRLDSAASEQVIFDLLKRKFGIQTPDTKRTWYDFKIKGYFVDLKITEYRTADNTNAKKAIYYVLTGDDPSNISDQEDRFFKSLSENIRENDKDYYYLILGKNADIGTDERAFVTSLRTLPNVRPSRNNMPFQCVWRKCLNKTVVRSHKEVQNFLLGKWGESISLDIKVLQSGMPTYFPQYIKGTDAG
ncbi:MAG: hypothetical protein OXU76_00780 [Alphaproteobacteria bacterium]|nr:hypothetical protein [Alphaproteobacteria bacterium]